MSLKLPPIVDESASASLLASLQKAAGEQDAITIDASAVTSIGIAGLQVLVQGSRECHAAGRAFSIGVVSQAFGEAARVSGLSNLLSVEG